MLAEGWHCSFHLAACFRSAQTWLTEVLSLKLSQVTLWRSCARLQPYHHRIRNAFVRQSKEERMNSVPNANTLRKQYKCYNRMHLFVIITINTTLCSRFCLQVCSNINIYIFFLFLLLLLLPWISSFTIFSFRFFAHVNVWNGFGITVTQIVYWLYGKKIALSCLLFFSCFFLLLSICIVIKLIWIYFCCSLRSTLHRLRFVELWNRACWLAGWLTRWHRSFHVF